MTPEQMTAIAADIEDVALRVRHRLDAETLERCADDLYAAAEAAGLEDRTIIDRHKEEDQ